MNNPGEQLLMDRIIRFHTIGDADVLRLERVSPPDLEAGEVLLRVEAFALNRADVLLRKGRYLESPELPSRLGYDAAGVVEAVGTGVSQVAVGERVFTLPSFSQTRSGVYGEWAILPERAVTACPPNLAREEASTLGIQYMTGYFGLFELGRLAAGQHVLITAASSSAGVAALGLVRAAGAVSIATTRTTEKKAPLLELGADHVIVTDEDDVAQAVRDITKGRGVEVIYDAVAGKGLEAFGSALAPRGVIVVYGMLGGTRMDFPLLPLFAKGASLHFHRVFDFVGMQSWGLSPNVAAVERALGFLLPRLTNGSLKPVVSRTFPIENVIEAHRYMESNQQVGKIVVTID